ncbi:MAG: NUDIX domain-containing protein [Bacteroidia bacterium]|jgi:8-oxo-dGTP diphosphatase|nr:NUDIX domain-containing protein [Bacteroidia bacterium]
MKRNSFRKHISVDCVIFGYDEENNKLEALLIEQKEPAKRSPMEFVPQFALPGDLVNEDEGLDAAAERVLKELTHVEGLNLRQFYCFGDPMRVKQAKDREWLNLYRSDPEARVITVAYYTLVRKEMIRPVPGSFARNVVWKNTKRVPPLAFDHNSIVKRALDNIRLHLESDKIAQELLPEKFTMRQLQNLYEAILNTSFDKRNFTKRFKKDDVIVELEEKQKGVLYKPARLYTFK